MSERFNAGSGNVLTGEDGELVAVRIKVEPRLLEEALEALAEVPFPINPGIHHQAGTASIIEFPAYRSRLDEVRRSLRIHGFDLPDLSVVSMREQIARTR